MKRFKLHNEILNHQMFHSVAIWTFLSSAIRHMVVSSLLLSCPVWIVCTSPVASIRVSVHVWLTWMHARLLLLWVVRCLRIISLLRRGISAILIGLWITASIAWLWRILWILLPILWINWLLPILIHHCLLLLLLSLLLL